MIPVEKNEGHDPLHGQRAAEYIESHLIECTAERWMLQSACVMHTHAQLWDGHKYTLFEKFRPL